MLKRVLLFVGTNIAIIAVLSVIIRLFNLDRFTSDSGINYVSLLVFAAVFGFGGAFISLAISRIIAKWIMGVKVIDPKGALGPQERWLVNTTHALCQAAGLKTMPEVGIYDSAEVNAFATGPTKSRSLVAVSSGLLTSMSPEAVEGVLAHEVAHIKNGDMVTMTLLQGVINTFVIFLSRVIAWAVARVVNEELSAVAYFVTWLVLNICLSILGAMVVMAFSRHREFRADAGAAELAGKAKMISALQGLMQNEGRVDVNQPALATMKISGHRGFLALLSSHPPLEERIKRLQQAV